MTASFSWTPSDLGGGGTITGFVQSLSDPQIFYARSDVAGVFKSTDRGESWQAINAGLNECHHHMVRSIAVHPLDENILLRCSGDAREHHVFGSIHKTVDGGVTWVEVAKEIDFYGNGPTRLCGEVIAFDPYNPAYVMAAGYTNGVWASYDSGDTWSYIDLKGERAVCLQYHPTVQGRVFLATCSDAATGMHPEETIRLYHDIPRPFPARLYLSEDGGETWELVSEGIDFSQLAFDDVETDCIYGATLKNGVLKSTDGGYNWQPCMDGLLKGWEYNTISVVHGRPFTLFTVPSMTGRDPDRPPIGVFRSTDHGTTWKLVHWPEESDLIQYPAYMDVYFAGWATSKIWVDYQLPQRLYMSNLYGVSVSEDGGQHWNAHYFKGTETICGENICADPTTAGILYLSLADHQPSVSRDQGCSYTAFSPGAYPGSSAITPSRHQPGFSIFGLINQQSGQAGLARTNDYGNTVETIQSFGEGLFVQGVVEDSFEPGRFYVYLDGGITQGAGLYCTQDWGSNWTKLGLKLPEYIQTLPHQKRWIEADLLPLVVYQVKNGCGSNQLLCADSHRPGVLYLGEWTEGVWAVFSDGRILSNLSSGLPFHKHKTSALVCLRADPRRPGHLYAGFIQEGLWRSENNGRTWKKLYPQDESIFNASSVDVGGQTGDEIVVACEPLYWSPAPPSVFYSPDLGSTWQNIYDPNLGALRWKGICFETGSGSIHGITGGNGCFRAEKK